MKDNGIWYFVANLITYTMLNAICLLFIVQIIENFLIRSVILIVLLLACGYIEEKILSRYINNFVKKLLNDEK